MKTNVLILKGIINMILAGIAISVGAYAYLQNIGPLGAILFSVGLIAVIHYKLFLYTGKIYAVCDTSDMIPLAGILVLNIIGCWLVSLVVRDEAVISACQQIVENRANLGFLGGIANGAGCGFIITMAVTSWKDTKLPLLIGIPAFIFAGFTHSVADAFYYTVGWDAVTSSALITYSGTVIGNFIGGIIYKAGNGRDFE